MNDRRTFLKQLGVSAAAAPFLMGLPSLSGAKDSDPVHRLIIMFSPNGTVPSHFWPDEVGEEFSLKTIVAPLEPFKKQTLFLRGISNKVRGDGDGHMRGMSCLLTAIELFPGNIQGGSDTPAGWAKGISIDQELKNFLQSRAHSKTRLGSLELGVAVPNRADPWTRMSYAGPNQPVAPVDDPYQVFEKVYGQMKDKDALKSILDDLQVDFKKVSTKVSSKDRQLLDEHLSFVREMEKELTKPAEGALAHAVPQLEPGVVVDNDNIPRISRMQIEMLVNSFANDLARIATLQYTNSVGNAKMRWVGVEEGHHTLSHDPDLKTESLEKLVKINTWYAGEMAYLAKRLSETPDPKAGGSMLDHTLIIWTNELGKGNSHTLDNIPFLCVGGGFGMKMGRSLKFEKVAHNRLWISIANAMGHEITTFGNPKLSEGGPLSFS